MNEALKMCEIRWDSVGDSAFKIGPNEFVWIEFGRIAWEAMDTQPPNHSQELAHNSAAMLVDIIPYNKNGAVQAFQQ